MSINLINSCIITDLASPNSEWFEWSSNTLESFDHEHTFIINPIIYTECSIGFKRIEELFNHLGFAIKQIPKEALFLAGKAFLNYKKNNGKKNNVLPDFLIGAHAAIEGYSLITRDKGRFSTYFPSVKLIMPK